MCATGPPNEVIPRRSAARKTSPTDPVTVGRARLPERLVRTGESVCGTCEDEQQVGEPVQVDRDERIDVVLPGRDERLTLGAPTDGPGNVKPGRDGCASGQHEALQLGQRAR